MSNLSEKFDHLPQDFDREAIWQGIEKPGKFGFIKPLAWGALILVVSLAGVWALSELQAPARQQEMSNTFQQVDNAAVRSERAERPSLTTDREDLHSVGLQNVQPDDLKSTPALTADQSFPNSEVARINSTIKESGSDPLSSEGTTNSTTSETPGADEINVEYNASQMNTGQQKSTVEDFQEIEDIRARVVIGHVPVITTFLKSNEITLPNTDPARIEVAKRRTNIHNLAIRAGIGSHFSDFISPDDGASEWRADLEKAQLDYSFGIRYEYVLKHDFYISLSAGYSLYKDRIEESFAREVDGEQVEVEYDLHNHYHLFTSELTAGKRFYQKEFFWDINAGVGVKVYQISEADYFTGEDQLADDELVQSLYESAPDVFFTTEAAIGRNISSRLYLRLGVQLRSRIELTSPDVQANHRILPMNGFLELGLRL